jgi:hypothetical protein
MHDINRTQMESGWETGGFGETGYETYEAETYPETYEAAFESSYGETGPLGEAEEMELAAELQEISNEQELDRFIGGLFNSVKKAVGSVLPPGVRNSLGGILKGVAKTVLPMAGAALGNFVVPGLGGMVGGKLASMAGQAFGLELEGLSQEDKEFEVNRRYIRLATDAAQQAALMPPTAPPQAIAQQAFRIAAQKHAPGLLAQTSAQTPMPAQQLPMQQMPYQQAGYQQQMPMQQAQGQQMGGNARGSSGRWIRRGRTLVLFGL